MDTLLHEPAMSNSATPDVKETGKASLHSEVQRHGRVFLCSECEYQQYVQKTSTVAQPCPTLLHSHLHLPQRLFLSKLTKPGFLVLLCITNPASLIRLCAITLPPCLIACDKYDKLLECFWNAPSERPAHLSQCSCVHVFVFSSLLC